MIKQNTKWPWNTLRAAILVLAPGLALAAGTADEYVREAERFLESGEAKSAIIELKNALQRDPAHADARILLGDLYLRLGDAPSAEKEFQRAARLDVARDRWLPGLGRAYLLQGDFNRVLDEITADPADADKLKAGLLVLRGLAHHGRGELSQAGEAYQESMQLQPGNPAALVAMARLAVAQDEGEKAQDLVNRALETNPDDLEALIIRGNLARVARRFDEAEKDFGRILELNPGHLQARVLRASVRLAKGEFDRAAEDLDVAGKRQPKNPAILYMRALLAFQKKDYDKAVEALQVALRVNPMHMQSQWLYGMVSYAKGDLEIAEEYLSRVAGTMPGNLQVIKLLAATRMKLKQTRQAIEVLEPALEGHPDDPQLMAMLGSAYLHGGDQAKGADLLARAVELEPDLAILRTELALGLLAKGKTDDAITELKSAVDLGQGLLQADILLVLSHLQKKAYGQALEASAALEKRMPDSPIPFNLTGLAYLAKGDKERAREKFNKALETDPDFLTAEMNLARIDLMEGNEDALEKRYKGILAKSRQHAGALMGLAALSERRGDAAATEQWLRQAQELNPKLPQPGILLTRFYLNRKEPLKALQAANEVFGRFPSHPNVLRILGEAQAAAGETHNAIRTFEMLTRQQKDSPGGWYLLGRAQLAAKELDKARSSLQRALELAPGFTQARIMLAGLELQAGNHDSAARLAGELQQNHPELAAGYELDAAVLLARKQPEKALLLYRKGYQAQPSSRLARILAGQYASLGKQAQAVAILEDWLAGHPEDAVALTLLGMQLQAMGRDAKAMSAYEKALESEPENLVVLNNLAWLYQTKGDERALVLGRKVYELAPERPEIVDTYGWILVQAGKVQKGLPILQQAMVSAPTNPEIAYHVAYAMHKAGRNEEAKKLLKRNIRDYPKSAVAAKVRGLLEQLK